MELHAPEQLKKVILDLVTAVFIKSSKGKN